MIDSLWSLALDRRHIDPDELARALAGQIKERSPDYRTRELMRESADLLRKRWGGERYDAWVAEHDRDGALADLFQWQPVRAGFPFLEKQVEEPTRMATVEQFLRELSLSVAKETRLHIGGSIALIAAGALSRRTQDIDVVDELPAVIRAQHDLLDRLAERYQLRLTHFQSHYLPDGWESRLRPLGRFRAMEVSVVDPLDIAAGKLFSRREKDRDDLRVLLPKIDPAGFLSHVKANAGRMLAEEALRENARENWYVLTGEELSL